jgi:hypothetical protein
MGEIHSTCNKVKNTDKIPDNPNGKVHFGDLGFDTEDNIIIKQKMECENRGRILLTLVTSQRQAHQKRAGLLNLRVYKWSELIE